MYPINYCPRSDSIKNIARTTAPDLTRSKILLEAAPKKAPAKTGRARQKDCQHQAEKPIKATNSTVSNQLGTPARIPSDTPEFKLKSPLWTAQFLVTWSRISTKKNRLKNRCNCDLAKVVIWIIFRLRKLFQTWAVGADAKPTSDQPDEKEKRCQRT